ncbi:MAG: error-prone DNA polymerase [Alphaproteobacteria bacterium]|nr:error-prone DNA polymerase [Alphaproteobacteria bacterium]
MSRAYAELQVLTPFSFLEGASHADELVARAKALGLAALGVADRNSLAGVVRAHKAAKEAGLKLLVGARLDFRDAPSVIAYPVDRAAYGRLSQLITLGRRRAEKGDCALFLDDLLVDASGLALIALGEDGAALEDHLRRLKAAADPGRLYRAASHLHRGDDRGRIARAADLARRVGVRLVATNDVLMHVRARRPLADVLTCIREKTVIDAAGRRLALNGERHLKGAEEMARLFRGHEDALAAGLEIVEQIGFSLDELAYDYPDEVVGEGETPQQSLARLTWEGAARRYPGGVPAKVRGVVEHELALIAQLGYAPYFLTVHDLVRFARERGILCQGRGSAANSAVCYCLGVTAVDPSKLDLLFERFVSAERGEPPDIDVDFEHERREEVIQYIYEKYGRERAGMTATVIHYRARGAVRDVGKAMGLSEDVTALMASQIWGWSDTAGMQERLEEIGLDPADRRLRQTVALIEQLVGFPRHLSQHVGGFVMTQSRLDSIVPVENAAMDGRTVIEWDKDDLDALGILKVDVLSLGMLTCLRKGFELIRAHYGRSLDLATVPPADKATYDMLCRADSLGVFQVESRAQMAFLPRMRPRDFYDLVIEVAIVRPGPIQGDMVHPYLRRRNGEERVSFPSPELERVLGKTLGVPLFQEQAMQIAIVAAGFTPAEADRLRRAMATFRKTGIIHEFHDKMVRGMIANGYDPGFAERCFKQIEGFGEYGFPESHAASFALLVYVSAWMKCHYPAAFAAALLNSQPMGFYAPAQIVRDATEHGVPVLPPDVNFSEWDCMLEANVDGVAPVQASPIQGEGGAAKPSAHAIRLGLRQVKGLSREDAEWVVAARANGYRQAVDLWRRAGLKRRALKALAEADAFGSLGISRREALWAVRGIGGDKPLPLFEAAAASDRGLDPAVDLPASSLGEEVAEDYASLRMSLKAHPMDLIRRAADAPLADCTAAGDLLQAKDGDKLSAAGLVLVRQRPGSANGVIFATLEDETGVANVVVWTDVFERCRRALLAARLMKVSGKLQREGAVIHLIADRVEDRSDLLDRLMDPEDGAAAARVSALAPTDEVRRPVYTPGFRGTGYHPVAQKAAPQKAAPKKPTPRPRHPRDQARTFF